MYQKQFSEYFDKHMDDILRDLGEIIAIESVADVNSPVKPFGEGSRKALDWGKAQLEKLGMTTKDFDGYAVHGDFYPEGECKLAVLSHLDTVPDCDGWTYPTFQLTQADGKLFGRGTIDDKGPSVAVLWAVKAIKELNVPITKNFRIIFGGNEEGGCEDMEYYESKQPFPEMVFTPDGSFPVLNCEKGMVHLSFEADFADDDIAEISGGTVVNAIPDKCRVTYKSGEEKLVCGKSSHGSRPENGDNAITKFLAQYKANSGKNGLLLGLGELFPHDEYNGASCKMGFSDDVSGEMTCALTVLKTEGGKLTGGIDIRFPIDRTLAEISGLITAVLEDKGFKVADLDGMEPHYVDEKSEFVQTLLRVYEKVKGEKGECIAEGGITYVHNTKGGVAFGAEFPEENNNMHGADEHISLETFKINLNMYANAIAELCK
ncbi:Sapep family Mn(2+)-dependent dipeptidase [Ruminococcus sp.]|uniref:Sapep family Mn(2+)-dependent dipeptidase n=1 Tax=Ruminococcus sp. TaxID=41978 RepID=UPI0025D10AFA|nr:Sapep family Mn(2+)-dependent dipeptidase [Ruminococcus sp.]